jgi:hypothetical protein
MIVALRSAAVQRPRVVGFDQRRGQTSAPALPKPRHQHEACHDQVVAANPLPENATGAFKFLGKFRVFGVFGGLAAAWAALRGFFGRKQA